MRNTRIKSCFPSEDVVCINTEHFCDGIMNCGEEGPFGHLAFDEQNCKTLKICRTCGCSRSFTAYATNGPDPGAEGPPLYDDLFPSTPPLSRTPSPTPATTNTNII